MFFSSHLDFVVRQHLDYFVRWFFRPNSKRFIWFNFFGSRLPQFEQSTRQENRCDRFSRWFNEPGFFFRFETQSTFFVDFTHSKRCKASSDDDSSRNPSPEMNDITHSIDKPLLLADEEWKRSSKDLEHCVNEKKLHCCFHYASDIIRCILYNIAIFCQSFEDIGWRCCLPTTIPDQFPDFDDCDEPRVGRPIPHQIPD